MSVEVLPLDAATAQALCHSSTATSSTVLLELGLRNVWLRGARPLAPPQQRVAGRAFTLRFAPAREDLATPASWAAPISTRAAIEAMPAGRIAVVDALGVTQAGIFGDILCARMRRRGRAGSARGLDHAAGRTRRGIARAVPAGRGEPRTLQGLVAGTAA